ncbi:hypothetical protein LZ575_03050 [Antarcticibacterium sp. 1MA-6-2]|uniref:hypothetical protein n=1 Tax=Antarcticibacterium sp. 1MA-6-2 TaxID=2908210 RepID=UPI001F257655|nr:hypothetical protein [Antarcticibacterium sp. 1MA-6-2]UJH91680.1 hypothetical protein LZ575_03050 [Antarcticibacterium sp. 1MA-6-2]
MITVNLPEEKTKAAKNIMEYPGGRANRYLLLDIKRLDITDREIFESLVELMGIRMQIESINKYLESTGAKEIIPTLILNEVVNHALWKEPLNDEYLEEYFNLQKTYKEHSKFLDKFSNTGDTFFDTKLDLALLGASFKDQWSTEHTLGANEEFYAEIEEEIITITESFTYGLIDYKTFIERAKELAGLITEEAERLQKKRNIEVYKAKEIKRPKG